MAEHPGKEALRRLVRAADEQATLMFLRDPVQQVAAYVAEMEAQVAMAPKRCPCCGEDLVKLQELLARTAPKEQTDDDESKLTGIELSRAVTEAARPLMKLMATMHPHHTAIVTCTLVELLEGVVCSGTILDYVKDMPPAEPKEAT